MATLDQIDKQIARTMAQIKARGGKAPNYQKRLSELQAQRRALIAEKPAPTPQEPAPPGARPPSWYRMDWLGGAKYTDLMIAEHPEGFGAALFAVTFGPAWKAIARLAETGRAPRLQVHSVWDDKHVYKPDVHNRQIMKHLARVNEYAQQWPSLRWQFSFFCEHSIKGSALLSIVKRIEAKADPRLVLVNSVYQGALVKRDRWVNEVHGKHSKPSGPFNYSTDGSSICDLDVEKFKGTYEAADEFGIWHAAFNGRLNDKDPTPRPKREAWPTSPLIDSLIYLTRDKGDFKNLPGTWIYKTHADRHSTPPEHRAYKPVLICPVNARRFEMVADNGQVIALSGPRGTFTDGRPLYRFDDQMGYQLAEKAKRIQGHPVVRLRAGGKFYGQINPAFRAGDYR